MKFLIIKTSSLGDILQAFPVAGYLREKFPNSQIDWVVEEEFAELVRANSQVSQVLCVQTRQWRRGRSLKAFFSFKTQIQRNTYDVVIDLQGNVKSGLILFFAKSQNKVGFGKATVPERPNLMFTNHRFDPPAGQNIREDYLFLVQSYFSDHEPFYAKPIDFRISNEAQVKVEKILTNACFEEKKKVLVCPGSAWINKQLTKEQLFDFLSRYRQKYLCEFLFCWGTEAEKQLSLELSKQYPGSILLEKLPLPTLQYLMGKMDLVISMDSLPLHLAGTTAVSTYSFFGPSLAAKYCPRGSQHHYFQGTCPYGRTFDKRCPILRTCPTGACLRSAKNAVLTLN